MATVRRALFIVWGRLTCAVSDHHDRGVVPATLVVTKQNAGNDSRMPAREPGIIGQIPVGCQPVAMQDKQRLAGKGELELLRPAQRMADGTVVGSTSAALHLPPSGT
jgi:hypothetical protein